MSQPGQAAAARYRGLLDMGGKGFVVLGAGQGIGAQVAVALSQCGGHVLCVDSDPAKADQVAAETGGIALCADVTRSEDMQTVFERAAERLKGRLEGVVDVVGMVLGSGLSNPDEALLQRQFDIVLKHAWLALRHGAAALHRGGSFTFVGSVAGMAVRSGPLLGYAAAKAALHNLASGAALELAPSGIRVNVVAPGLTRTPRLVAANPAAFWEQQERQIPLGRAAVPEDIAASVLFLASTMATHVTGNVLAVDGGSVLLQGGGLGIAKSGTGGY